MRLKKVIKIIFIIIFFSVNCAERKECRKKYNQTESLKLLSSHLNLTHEQNGELEALLNEVNNLDKGLFLKKEVIGNIIQSNNIDQEQLLSETKKWQDQLNSSSNKIVWAFVKLHKNLNSEQKIKLNHVLKEIYE